LCTTAIDPAEMSLWVIFDIFGDLVDVRFTPNSDRDSDFQTPYSAAIA
jgi:hypothetical protein